MVTLSPEACSRDKQGDKRVPSFWRISGKKKLVTDQKIVTISDSQGQKQRDSNGRLVLKQEMRMTLARVPQRLFSLLKVQKQEVPECLAIWYPACPSEEGALGGQLVAVTLAEGRIFWIRDFRESSPTIGGVLCATLFSAWTHVKDSLQSFCPGFVFVRGSGSMTPFTYFDHLISSLYITLFINLRILGAEPKESNLLRASNLVHRRKECLGITDGHILIPTSPLK